MFQTVELTYDEKIAMYKKCSKKELAEMVIECNRLLDMFTYKKQPYKKHVSGLGSLVARYFKM